MKNFIKLLKKYKIDGYIVPKNDEYFNEFASPSNDRLKFISNFSGSAGFAIILKNKNYLFVDGRYTIQARYQSGKKFRVITIPNKFPKDVFKSNKKIVFGFDPKLHTEKQLNYLFKIKNVKLKSIKQNLVDKVWLNKPKSLVKPFFLISPKNAGATVTQKIRQVKSILSKNKVDYLLVTAPENVAWILNIRGHDSYYSPVPNAI
jgi:Xaa-Pro aminopeptidase